MKNLFFCLFGVLGPLCLNAQVKVYFNNLDVEVATKDSSVYYSVGRLNSVGLYHDTVKYYYSESGRIRGFEIYEDGVLDGTFCFYYENGNVSSRGVYKRGSQFGEMRLWYVNGQLRQVINRADDTELVFSGLNYRFIQQYDSLGVAKVDNGNGFFNDCIVSGYSQDPQVTQRSFKSDSLPKRYNSSQRTYRFRERMSGKVWEGLRDSVWLVYIDGVLRRKELIKKGKLVSGESFSQGKVFPYSEVESSAYPYGGMNDFYKSVMSRVRYPKEARKNGVQGRVLVQFVIQTDGAISDIKIVQGIGGGCDEAAMDAVRQAPKWFPGLQYGIPVRQRFTMPINFRL
jgi:TonB family protein